MEWCSSKLGKEMPSPVLRNLALDLLEALERLNLIVGLQWLSSHMRTSVGAAEARAEAMERRLKQTHQSTFTG